MKYIILAILLNFSAQAKTILLCLGKEESYYAKNYNTGPKYSLNQIMINEISSAGNPHFRGNRYDKFCKDPTNTPSLRLLEEMIIGKDELFVFEAETETEKRFAIDTYNDFRKRALKVLLQYIAKLQIQIPTHDCLTNNIPGLSEFYNRFRYLEGEIELKQLKGSKDNIKKIFVALDDIDGIMNKCKKLSNKENR